MGGTDRHAAVDQLIARADRLAYETSVTGIEGDASVSDVLDWLATAGLTLVDDPVAVASDAYLTHLARRSEAEART
jgi:hypothetical protein